MIVSLRPHLFRKVTIVGVGLIGGSVAKGLRKHRLSKEIVGLGQSHQNLTEAQKNGIIDQGFQDVAKAVANADLVVLAAPVGTIVGLMSTMGPHLKRGCIVTDVGSTKMTIVSAAQKFLPKHVLFVGSHPVAGSEKMGFTHASAELFEGATCIMTPVEETHRLAKERVKHLWTKLGAQVKFMTPEEHDKILSSISHLPHMLAYALIESVPSEYLTSGGKGFKDMTRIAASSPQMWADIGLNNKSNIIRSLDEVVKNLSLIRKAISTNDQKSLLNFLKNAKTKRDTIN